MDDNVCFDKRAGELVIVQDVTGIVGDLRFVLASGVARDGRDEARVGRPVIVETNLGDLAPMAVDESCDMRAESAAPARDHHHSLTATLCSTPEARE